MTNNNKNVCIISQNGLKMVWLATQPVKHDWHHERMSWHGAINDSGVILPSHTNTTLKRKILKDVYLQLTPLSVSIWLYLQWLKAWNLEVVDVSSILLIKLLNVPLYWVKGGGRLWWYDIYYYFHEKQ